MKPAVVLDVPGPTDVPDDLTIPSRQYRWRVVVVLVSLFVFLLMYLAMIGGAAFLLWYAVRLPIGPDEVFPLLWKGLAILGSGLLLVFLLRGLFRRRSTAVESLVEIREEEQPILFGFVRKLCAELNAPFPDHVYLSHDVNAAMIANTSILNLLLPTRRSLLIGLGLVNALNLTELKAVLAHELGHFSQRSTRLTRYVYAVSPVMADIVYRRDWLDVVVNRVGTTLFNIAASDLRLLVIGVALTFPLVVPLLSLWLFRILLEELYKAINFQSLSLLRQMEFNADLIAASVTGSDAPVHVLVRLMFATELLELTRDELAGAADHGVYTRDLFYHQRCAAGYLRQLLKDPRRGEPPPLAPDPSVATQVFQPKDQGMLAMWATHPPHHERELNLKQRYIRSPFDERSAWALFEDVEQVRGTVTELFYRELLALPAESAFTEPEKVQALIEAERSAATYSPSYLGVYDDRYLEPGDLDAHVALVNREPWEADRLAQAHALLFDTNLNRWMEAYRQRCQEHQTLRGVSPGANFEFRGQQYRAGDAQRLCNQVGRELDQDRLQLADLDRRVFMIHYRMGAALKSGVTQELTERYRFHLATQEVLQQLSAQHDWVASVLHFLSGATELYEEQYREIVQGALHAHQVLRQALATADGLVLPALPHVVAGSSLGAFLMQKHTLADFRLDEKALRPKVFGTSLLGFGRKLGELRDRVRRIHFKSLGGILALQEAIHAAWAAQRSPSPLPSYP